MTFAEEFRNALASAHSAYDAGESDDQWRRWNSRQTFNWQEWRRIAIEFKEEGKAKSYDAIWGQRGQGDRALVKFSDGSTYCANVTATSYYEQTWEA